MFDDKYYTIGHKFTISVTMDVSPFAWCLGRAVLNYYGKMLIYTENKQPVKCCLLQFQSQKEMIKYLKKSIL